MFFYGAGRTCRSMAWNCNLFGLYPDYVVDQNPELWGTSITFDPLGRKREVSVISPDEMQSYGLDSTVLITTMLLDCSVRALKERGFTNLWIPPPYDTVQSEALFSANKPSIDQDRKSVV